MSASKQPMHRNKGSEPMRVGGEADPTVKAHANHVRIGNCFLDYIKSADPVLHIQWGLDWSKLKEAHACSREIYEHLATYLVEVYLIDQGNINAGKHLSFKVALQVWSGLIQHQKRAFPHSTVRARSVRAACALPRAIDSITHGLCTLFLPSGFLQVP